MTSLILQVFLMCGQCNNVKYRKFFICNKSTVSLFSPNGRFWSLHFHCEIHILTFVCYFQNSKLTLWLYFKTIISSQKTSQLFSRDTDANSQQNKVWFIVGLGNSGHHVTSSPWGEIYWSMKKYHSKNF